MVNSLIQFLMKIIICSNLILYSSSSIYVLVNGNLSNKFQMKLKIFIDNLDGVLINAIDTEGNNLEFSVIRNINNIKNVRLEFNGKHKILPLNKLCKCDPCEYGEVGLVIKMLNQNITVYCSQETPLLLPIIIQNQSIIDKGDIKYLVPTILKDKINTTYIVMGTTNTRINEQTVSSSHLSKQMTGCLHYFDFNNQPVTFIGEETYLKSHCPTKCSGTICNHGKCIQNRQGMSCDCTNTALNGFYCNRGLMTFNYNGEHNYETTNDTYKMSFKMSWKQHNKKDYCLMEIIWGYETFVIMLKDHRLMANSFLIGFINIKEANYIIVYLSNEFLKMLTLNDKSLTVPSIFNKKAKINIGYSSSNKECVPFEGLYDLEFKSKDLRQSPKLSSTKSIFSSISKNSSNLISTIENKNIFEKMMSDKVLIVTGILALWSLVTLIFFISKCINKYCKCKCRNSKSNGGVTDPVYDIGDYDVVGPYHPVNCERCGKLPIPYNETSKSEHKISPNNTTEEASNYKENYQHYIPMQSTKL